VYLAKAAEFDVSARRGQSDGRELRQAADGPRVIAK